MEFSIYLTLIGVIVTCFIATLGTRGYDTNPIKVSVLFKILIALGGALGGPFISGAISMSAVSVFFSIVS